MFIFQIIIGIIIILAFILMVGYAAVGGIYKGAGGTHIYGKPPKAPAPNRRN